MDRKSFDELYNLPCEGKTEEKNGLAYLSWAYAWATLLGQDPTATKKVYEAPDGLLVWKDPVGCHVKVSVTAFGIERTEYLPVMDYRNQSVPFDKADSMIVNKTIQRAVTKAIAQFGIGLKLYAGEDLPTKDDDKPQNDAPQAPKPQTVPNADPKPKAEAESTKSMTGNAQQIYDEMMKMMRELDPAQAIGLMDWCKRKFGKGPNDLADINQILATISAIKAAKFKASQPIDDDNMPF